MCATLFSESSRTDTKTDEKNALAHVYESVMAMIARRACMPVCINAVNLLFVYVDIMR